MKAIQRATNFLEHLNHYASENKLLKIDPHISDDVKLKYLFLYLPTLCRDDSSYLESLQRISKFYKLEREEQKQILNNLLPVLEDINTTITKIRNNEEEFIDWAVKLSRYIAMFTMPYMKQQ